MSKQHQLKALIIRYQQGKCSPEEIQELRTMLAAPENTELLEELYDSLPDGLLDDNLLQQKADIYQQILQDERVRRKVKESGSIHKDRKSTRLNSSHVKIS